MEDNVVIGAGATLLGPITIGTNSKVAAGAIIRRNIPSRSTAYSNEHIITHEE